MFSPTQVAGSPFWEELWFCLSSGPICSNNPMSVEEINQARDGEVCFMTLPNLDMSASVMQHCTQAHLAHIWALHFLLPSLVLLQPPSLLKMTSVFLSHAKDDLVRLHQDVLMTSMKRGKVSPSEGISFGWTLKPPCCTCKNILELFSPNSNPRISSLNVLCTFLNYFLCNHVQQFNF